MKHDLSHLRPDEARDTPTRLGPVSADVERLGTASDADSTDEAINCQALQRRVQLFLAASNLPALRHICVEIDGDTVFLGGAVRTYYEKQMAVQLASRVAGVVHVRDSLVVRSYVPLPRRRQIGAPARDERAAALYGA